ncbi:MAG TPA: hypothetical protein VGC34_04250 [Steroidobacteraceae bacterium]
MKPYRHNRSAPRATAESVTRNGLTDSKLGRTFQKAQVVCRTVAIGETMDAHPLLTRLQKAIARHQSRA